MIFIIDIDCCVFFWFQGAFFLGGWDCAAEAWPSRVRWGLAGWIVFFFVGWSGSSGTVYWVYGLSRVWQELTLKYIEIYWNHWRSLRRSVCSWRPSSTMGRSETVQRCKSQQEVGGEIPRKWNVYAVCDLYVFYMVFWFEHGLILGVFSIQTKHTFFWAKKTYDTSKSGIRVLSWQGAAPKRAEPLQYGDGFWRLLGFPPSRATPVFFVEHSRNPTGQWTIPELNGGLELGKSCHKWGIFKCYVWLPEGRLKIGMGGLLCSLPQVWKFWVFGLGYLGKDTLVESWQRRFPVISLHVLWMKIGYLPSFFRQIHRVEGTW